MENFEKLFQVNTGKLCASCENVSPKPSSPTFSLSSPPFEISQTIVFFLSSHCTVKELSGLVHQMFITLICSPPFSFMLFAFLVPTLRNISHYSLNKFIFCKLAKSILILKLLLGSCLTTCMERVFGRSDFKCYVLFKIVF